MIDKKTQSMIDTWASQARVAHTAQLDKIVNDAYACDITDNMRGTSKLQAHNTRFDLPHIRETYLNLVPDDDML